MNALSFMQCSSNFPEVYDVHFSNMVEQTLEVFMDDFSVFGETYDDCLHNLEDVVKRYEITTWYSIGKNATL